MSVQEICLLRALSYDPNIVQFYGACLDPEFPLLGLEYMQGGDLREAIQKDFDSQPPKKFGWYGKGAKIALDVAKGLVFLHANKASPRIHCNAEWTHTTKAMHAIYLMHYICMQ